MNPFIKSQRDDGTTLYSLSDDAPDGLLEAVHEAHGGTLPNDWIWEECANAWSETEDLTDSDALHEYADGRVEIYTKAIYAWAADMVGSSIYSDAEDEANDLMSGDDTGNVEKRFQAIQYVMIARIASVIAEFKSSLDTEGA